MFKLIIIFKKPAEQIRDFEIRYNEMLGLVERMPGILRLEVTNVLGSPSGESPYYRMLTAYFANQGTMEEAMLSSVGQEAGTHIMSFPEDTFELVLADSYEESGGVIRQRQKKQGDS